MNRGNVAKIFTYYILGGLPDTSSITVFHIPFAPRLGNNHYGYYIALSTRTLH